MKSSDFDQKFDDGEDITSALDLTSLRRPGRGPGFLLTEPQLDSAGPETDFTETPPHVQ